MAEPISAAALIGAGIASSATAAAGSAISTSIRNKKSYKYSVKFLAEQEKYRKLALQDSIDQWNRQNTYDSPVNQTARLRSAGISPLSDFGVQGSQGLSSVQGVDGSQFDASAPSIPSIDAAGMLLDLESLKADIDLKKAQADNLRGDTRDPDETKRGQRIENDLLEQRVIGEKLANRITQNDVEFSDYALGNRKRLSDAEVVRAVETNNKIIADTALSVSQKNLTEQQARESVARILQTEAQTALLLNQNKWYGKLTEAQIKSIYQGIDESVNRMSLNDSIKFLNAAKEWNTMADTKGKELANWRQELANALDKEIYAPGDSDDPNLAGNLIYALEKVFDIIK
nr:MAG TPA: DNA pilot protein VP2 [Microviridae sp.]